MYRDNDKKMVDKKNAWIKEVAKEMNYKLSDPQIFHYASLEVLFNILEGDSFWVSNARFSNDSTEERILSYERRCEADNFIICFSDDGDKLSQWRGYCHEGGASIQFSMRSVMEYSILHSDYDTSHKYERYWNAPLPVLYVEKTMEQVIPMNDFMNSIKDTYKPVLVDDIIPYFKNSMFSEERERRLVFTNFEGNLSSCIRFRSLKNGVKVPYMVVKCGDVGKNFSKCQVDISIYDKQYLQELHDTKKPIIIPEGSDQESVYYKIADKVKEFYQERKEKRRKIEIYCRGHLPIKKITIAPKYDRELVMEEVKNYCMNRYWLRNVEVEVSKIPFVQPLR